MIRRVLPTVMLAAAVAGARAQENEATVVPAFVLGQLRQAYRSEPVAERMLLTLTDTLGRVWRQRITVRVDATDRDAGVAALDLGRLRVIARGPDVAVTHEDNPRSVWRGTLDGPPTAEALSGLLGPLPVPQLALAFGGPDVALLPRAPGLAWEAAEAPEPRAHQTLVLTGRSRVGGARMTIDARSWRLRSMRVSFERRGEPATLELEVEGVPAGDPAGWGPDLAGRREVASPAALLDEVGPIQPGMRVPDITLLTIERERWSLHEALGEAAAGPMALVFMRRGTDESLRGEILRDAAAGLEAWKAAGGGANRAATAWVVGLREMDASFMIELAASWRAIGGEALLLWSTNAARTIDHFSRDADAVMAVIDPPGVLLGTLVLDGRAEDPGALAREVGALLDGGPERPKGDPAPG